MTLKKDHREAIPSSQASPKYHFCGVFGLAKEDV
jgi:hypothetical protein